MSKQERLQSKRPLSATSKEAFAKQFKITLRAAETLLECPVDEFFSASHNGNCAHGKILHGVSLKSLANHGYLNAELDVNTGSMEYYINNNGHRLIEQLKEFFGDR